MANSCPKCGAELPAGSTVCVNCGASANAKPDVDNSAEISRMFGKESDNVVVGSDELSDTDIAAFESGKAIEFSSGGGLSEDAMESIAAMNEIKFDEILSAEQDAEPAVSFDDGNSGDFGDSDHDDDDIIIQKGVTEVHGFRLPATVKRIIVAVFILAAGFGLGFGLHYFLSLGIYAGYTNDTALSSVREVLIREIPQGQRFKAIEIYVKRGADRTECIVFGVLFSESNNYTPTYYRLTIKASDFSDVAVYPPFNQQQYDILSNSSDPLESLTASTMMSDYNNFLRAVNEINSGNPLWERADVEYVNKKLLTEGSPGFSNDFGTPKTICAEEDCENYIAPSGDTLNCESHSNKCSKCKIYIDGGFSMCTACEEK